MKGIRDVRLVVSVKGAEERVSFSWRKENSCSVSKIKRARTELLTRFRVLQVKRTMLEAGCRRKG